MVSEFEQHRGIGPMDPGANIRESHVRAQEILNSALAIREASGAERVSLEVGSCGVHYTIVPTEAQLAERAQLTILPEYLLGSGLPNFSEQKSEKKSPKKRKVDNGVPSKRSKNPDRRGLTGFYRGVFYRDGEAQISKSRQEKIRNGRDRSGRGLSS